MPINDIPPYKCGKCGSRTLYNDDDRLKDIKFIACLTCGNRYPPGQAPVKIEKSGFKENFVKANSKDEGMENTQRIDTEAGNKPLCKQCGLKPTISAGSPYCPSCMAKRSHKKRKGSENVSMGVKKERAYTGKPEPTPPSKASRDTITIEFKRHISILKEVEKLADQEMRPLDCQILYMLKRYIEAEVQ